jgi:DNA-directed RNA polymerase specialized sigma24 family protein
MNDGSDDRFPDTPAGILRRAAAGHWHEFIDLYFRPCRRAMAEACRGRGIPAADADDLFQVLLLRLMRAGRSRTPGVSGKASPLGNMPARYLQGSLRRNDVARFRTFLKAAILNIVREELRRRTRRRHRQQPLDDQLAIIEPLIDQTVEHSLHLRRLADGLRRAAQALADESAKQPTQGRRRYFDVLKRSIVERQSVGAIALAYDVDRTNISRLLTAARSRYLAILRRTSGIDDRAELKRSLTSNPEILRTAFAAVAAPRAKDDPDAS